MARCEYCGEHGFWEPTPAGYRIYTTLGRHTCAQYLRAHATRLRKEDDFTAVGGTVDKKQQPPALNLFD